MSLDQFAHMLRHVATQGGEEKPHVYGHIASYDPMQHRVRCIIPSMMDQDGVPTLSPWMPMGTMSAGAGYGIQVIYQGGATVENPTAGEQVKIDLFDKQRGVSVSPCTFFHATNRPPATNLPTTADGYGTAADAAVAGDVIISAPSQQPGGANSFIRVRKSGQVQVWSAGLVSADVIGGINVTVNTGDVNITIAQGNASITLAQGNATLTAATGNVTVQAAQTVNIIGAVIRFSSAVGDALHSLCTDVFQGLYNRHTHPNNGVPNLQADATSMTRVVSAE
jgi:hypothetical protein